MEVEQKVEQKVDKVEQKVEQKVVEKKEGEEEEEKGQAPIGNGGSTDLYTWTQTLEEVQIYIPVENTLKGKDCKIELHTKNIKIIIKNILYFEGELCNKINSEDSLWTLETSQSQKHLHLTLEKWKTEWTWWNCICINHPSIDTSKINPEPS